MSQNHNNTTTQQHSMKYKMHDGTFTDTSKALSKWEEGTRFDGRNNVSLATGTQWEHETLYLSSRGRYYIERGSQWAGSIGSAEYISETDAVRWLMQNEQTIPALFQGLASSITE